MGLTKVGDIGHFVDSPEYTYYVNCVYDGKPSEVIYIAGPIYHLGKIGNHYGTHLGYSVIFKTLYSASSLEKFLYKIHD